MTTYFNNIGIGERFKVIGRKTVWTKISETHAKWKTSERRFHRLTRVERA